MQTRTWVRGMRANEGLVAWAWHRTRSGALPLRRMKAQHQLTPPLTWHVGPVVNVLSHFAVIACTCM
jgi:hypothetical protein